MSDENKIPDLKVFNTLKLKDVNNAKIVTDDEFSDVIDAIVNKDYKNIPNSVRLPSIKKELAEKLGLEKDAAFILKQAATHINPTRKSTYGQAFTIGEYKSIPRVIRNADFAVIDIEHRNFQIVFDDDNNPAKINKLVFNKDRLGNYLVTIGKVDRIMSFSEKTNAVVSVGVAPTIPQLKMSSASTMLRASKTTALDVESISQPQNLSSENSHNLQINSQIPQKANMENKSIEKTESMNEPLVDKVQVAAQVHEAVMAESETRETPAHVLDIIGQKEVFKLQPSEFGIRIRTDSDLILLKEKAMELDAGNTWNKDLWIPCFYATINGVPKSLEYIYVHSFSDGKCTIDRIIADRKVEEQTEVFRMSVENKNQQNEKASGVDGRKSQSASGNIVADRSRVVTTEKTEQNIEKKLDSFEFENYNFLPVRKFFDDNEKQFVHDNLGNNSLILNREILQRDFPVEQFRNISLDNGEGYDIFYCVETGRFY